jgi:ketosteroid isomerase-like protein
MEIADSPKHAIQIFDRAFNEGDLHTIMEFYDEAALVVPQPGVESRGKEAIRGMYGRMLQPGMVARQIKTRVLEADGVALLISQWSLSQPGHTEKTLISTTLLRRKSDGGGKAFIDNSQGPAILDL